MESDLTARNAPHSQFMFVEISQRNLEKYSKLLKDSLKTACAVGFAVHTTTSSEISDWWTGETLDRWHARNVTASLQGEVIGIGISIASVTSDVNGEHCRDLSAKPRFTVQNFNLTTCTMAPSMVKPADLKKMLDLGYDYNYVASEGISYYRGRNDEQRQADTSQTIRKIFLDVHGHDDTSHAVVMRNALSEILTAFAALVGLPGDSAPNLLERIYDLFPGKLYDADLLDKQISVESSESADLFECLLSLEGIDTADRRQLDEPLSGDNMKSCKVKVSNTKHPAVLDAFNALSSFLRFIAADVDMLEGFLTRDSSKQSRLQSMENRLTCRGLVQQVVVQPVPGSRFRPSKRQKKAFDYTIPLSDVVTVDDARL